MACIYTCFDSVARDGITMSWTLLSNPSSKLAHNHQTGLYYCHIPHDISENMAHKLLEAGKSGFHTIRAKNPKDKIKDEAFHYACFALAMTISVAKEATKLGLNPRITISKWATNNSYAILEYLFNNFDFNN